MDTVRSRPPGAPRFEELYPPQAEVVARICRRMLGPGAEDAAQQVFVRARQGFGGYDPARPFRPWLLAIAGNHCIDEIRRRGRERRLFAEEEEPPELPDPGPSPLGQTLAAERRERLAEAIDALPHKLRLALALRYFHDLDYRAIAELLQVTANEVGVLLHRAKRRLREELGGGAS